MVYQKTGKHSGKVLECDGDTVYLVQANGVEIEFPSHELTAAAPAEKHPLAPSPDNLSRVLTMNDITPEHHKVLAVIPQRKGRIISGGNRHHIGQAIGNLGLAVLHERKIGGSPGCQRTVGSECEAVVKSAGNGRHAGCA